MGLLFVLPPPRGLVMFYCTEVKVVISIYFKVQHALDEMQLVCTVFVTVVIAKRITTAVSWALSGAVRLCAQYVRRSMLSKAAVAESC